MARGCPLGPESLYATLLRPVAATRPAIATRAYAWSSPIEGSGKRRFIAAPHAGAIKSPLDAAPAAIVAEHRSRSK